MVNLAALRYSSLSLMICSLVDMLLSARVVAASQALAINYLESYEDIALAIKYEDSLLRCA